MKILKATQECMTLVTEVRQGLDHMVQEVESIGKEGEAEVVAEVEDNHGVKER